VAYYSPIHSNFAMQIYAYDVQGNLIPVASAHRGSIYRCPECCSSLRVRGGKLRQLHFYHMESSTCRLHGKSSTHLHIQYSLQKMLYPEKILLEHRFPEIGRVADVVWEAQKIIFEVQVSLISSEEVCARMRDYQVMGYQVIWIFHDRHFNNFRLTPAEIQLRCSPHYFTNINAFGKGIFYDQYSLVRHKKRIQRGPRLPLLLNKVLPVNFKQLPRQLPKERQKWPLSFEGDLISRPHLWTAPRPLARFKSLGNLPRILLHFFLEKTTY
jgi:competence protein CoiA